MALRVNLANIRRKLGEPEYIITEISVEYWIINDSVAYKSYKNNKLYVEKHIKPQIGNLRFDAVRPVHIKKIFKDETGLSTSARSHINIALNGIFETAIVNHFCTTNPCKNVKPQSTPKKAPKAWTVAQVGKIFSFALTHEFGVIPSGCFIRMPGGGAV